MWRTQWDRLLSEELRDTLQQCCSPNLPGHTQYCPLLPRQVPQAEWIAACKAEATSKKQQSSYKFINRLFLKPPNTQKILPCDFMFVCVCLWGAFIAFISTYRFLTGNNDKFNNNKKFNNEKFELLTKEGAY